MAFDGNEQNHHKDRSPNKWIFFYAHEMVWGWPQTIQCKWFQWFETCSMALQWIKLCWLIQILEASKSHTSFTEEIEEATQRSAQRRVRFEAIETRAEHFTSIEYYRRPTKIPKNALNFEYFWPDRECGNVSFGHCITNLERGISMDFSKISMLKERSKSRQK